MNPGEAGLGTQVALSRYKFDCLLRDYLVSLGSSMPWAFGRLVLSSGALAGGSCALIYYVTQKAFSKASYYQLALEQLHSHPEALEALGAPLSVHHLHLTDRDNFVDIASARVAPSGGRLKASGWSADSRVQAQ
ncbi:cytochrome c oxidase assembly factor 1 homolog isoform X3 [Lutra lutra]|uniref:cytochrome c oxidase assembly factor 1 homolog isoform X3 n=1 Tax=Lutra lutra TaxID=9657 RepID=UPI001FD3A147|nr:cytochrome c oxidase assembly factor 1 homolog isoform X3 [Lutra lutra]